MAEATHLLGLPRKHKPKDIKPQGHASELDADKVDGFHASELGGGGGPHATSHETGGADKVHFADLERDEADITLHDAFTDTPHIPQSLKDKIHDRLHDHSLPADGSPIAVVGVPDLPTTKIASGRFGMARMPDGTSGYVLTAKGIGVDPVYEIHTVGKGCKVGLSANQSVTSGIWTVINYTNILFDDFGEWDTVNFRFVPVLSGRYLITFAVLFSDMADGTDVEARFQQTTPTPLALIYGFNRPGGAGFMSIFGASVHELVAGRQYQQLAYQVSGATKTLGGHYSYNYLSIARLF